MQPRHALGVVAASLVLASALLPVPALATAAGAAEIGDLPRGATLSEDHTLVLELDAAVALANRRSHLVPAALAGVEIYRGKLREAESAMLPSFEATGFFSLIPTKRAGTTGENLLEDWDWTQPRPLATAQLTFNQVLTTFGKLNALEAMAHLGVDIAEATRQVALAELRYQVTRAWWALVMAADLDEMTRKGRGQIQHERERLEALRDDGDERYDSADMAKLLGVEAEFEDKVRAAARARDLAEDTLRFALRLDVPWRIRASATTLEPVPLQLLPDAAYESLAVANQPRELARRKGLLVRWEQVVYEKRKLLPDLVFTGRLATVYAPESDTGGDSLASNPTNPTQSGAGLALRWRLDVFRQLTRIDQARATYDRDRHTAALELQKTRAAIRHIVRETRDRAAVLALSERATRALRGQMVQSTDLADRGMASRADAMRAIETYVRRRVAHAENLYRYNVLVAELSRAIGVDVVALRPRAAEPAAEAP